MTICTQLCLEQEEARRGYVTAGLDVLTQLLNEFVFRLSACRRRSSRFFDLAHSAMVVGHEDIAFRILHSGL